MWPFVGNAGGAAIVDVVQRRDARLKITGVSHGYIIGYISPNLDKAHEDLRLLGLIRDYYHAGSGIYSYRRVLDGLCEAWGQALCVAPMLRGSAMVWLSVGRVAQAGNAPDLPDEGATGR